MSCNCGIHNVFCFAILLLYRIEKRLKSKVYETFYFFLMAVILHCMLGMCCWLTVVTGTGILWLWRNFYIKMGKFLFSGKFLPSEFFFVHIRNFCLFKTCGSLSFISWSCLEKFLYWSFHVHYSIWDGFLFNIICRLAVGLVFHMGAK